MDIETLPGVDVGHAHGVDLEATLDFLNTLDLENGFPLAAIDEGLAQLETGFRP